jgi:signal transduction histidine kinase
MVDDGEGQNSSTDVDGTQKGTVEEWLMLSDEIYSNIQAAVDVLNDLLNYDKIESGTLSLEFTVLQFWQLIEETVGEFKLSAMQQDINLILDFSGLAAALSPESISGEECDMGPPLTAAMLRKSMECHVVGDRIRLIQVLRNLVSNGLKFTPEKGKVTVCTGVAACWPWV